VRTSVSSPNQYEAVTPVKTPNEIQRQSPTYSFEPP
jgi:hypothetical protein